LSVSMWRVIARLASSKAVIPAAFPGHRQQDTWMRPADLRLGMKSSSEG
jgi:hypothetical protein